ncbi:MAG: SulP family inorganic anion transporter [Syntrophobacterales bacterium]|jgi:SulP family sulfate permease
MADIIPFLSWIRGYGRRHFGADLIGGLTVAVVAVPQCMAYALIAGLPVQYGLYAAIVPAIVGSLWGSSAQLITGPTTAISLVVLSTLIQIAQPGSSHYLELAFFLALMVGVIQIVMGFARLGSLLNFVSHSVILGFTAGAAVLIGFKQIPNLLGLNLEKTSIFLESLVKTASHMHETHIITTALGQGGDLLMPEADRPHDIILEAAGNDSVVVMGASLRHDVHHRLRGSLPLQVLAKTESSMLLAKLSPEVDTDFFEELDTC